MLSFRADVSLKSLPFKNGITFFFAEMMLLSGTNVKRIWLNFKFTVNLSDMMYVYGVAGGRWVVLNVKARHDKRYAFGIQFFFVIQREIE